MKDYQMHYATALETLLRADMQRMATLTLVRETCHHCWIGAGFVRDAVWDHLHNFPPHPPTGDVDVIWRNPDTANAEYDQQLEAQLHALVPDIPWSVKNQARMHVRNGDAPYASLDEALWHWPETATAVAVQLDVNNKLAIIAPFGLDDLFALRLRATPRFQQEKQHLFHQRVSEKQWLARYPLLRLCPPADDMPESLCYKNNSPGANLREEG